MSITIHLAPRDTGGSGEASASAFNDEDAWEEIMAFIAMCKARSLDPAQEVIKAIQHAHDAMLAE